MFVFSDSPPLNWKLGDKENDAGFPVPLANMVEQFPLRPDYGQPSSQMVTGPSLMSATSISAPNLPSSVGMPPEPSALANRP